MFKTFKMYEFGYSKLCNRSHFLIPVFFAILLSCLQVNPGFAELAPWPLAEPKQIDKAQDERHAPDLSGNCGKEDWQCKNNLSIDAGDFIFHLNGLYYTKHQLSHDFLDAVISRQLWKENVISSATFFSYKNTEKENKQEILQKFPQFYEFIYREKGLPKAFTLNRRSSDIIIALDAPDISPFFTANCNYCRKNPFADYTLANKANEIVKERIMRLAPEIEALTGLKILFADDAKDHVQPTNLRIITSSHFLKHSNKIKEGVTLIKAGVEFTPNNVNQVDGYFIPNEKNEIEYSECNIRNDVDPIEISDYATECLIRSLGFPEIAPTIASSALSTWGSRMDEQGELKGRPKCDNPEFCGYTTADSFPAIANSREKLHAPRFTKLTDYDKAQISILYCAELNPAMDANTIMAKLYQSKTCFLKNKQE